MAWEVEFYLTPRGDSPVEEFIQALSPKARAKCLSYLVLLAEQGNALPAQYIKHISGDLWEIRPEFGGAEYRFFYVLLTAEVLVVLHAFTKKTQRTPPGEIARALSRMLAVTQLLATPPELLKAPSMRGCKKKRSFRRRSRARSGSLQSLT